MLLDPIEIAKNADQKKRILRIVEAMASEQEPRKFRKQFNKCVAIWRATGSAGRENLELREAFKKVATIYREKLRSS